VTVSVPFVMPRFSKTVTVLTALVSELAKTIRAAVAVQIDDHRTCRIVAGGVIARRSDGSISRTVHHRNHKAVTRYEVADAIQV
jgi:hypothetical protein